MNLDSIPTRNCSLPGHHESQQGEELQNHQMEAEKEEENKEGCSSVRSVEPIWKWFYCIWRWLSFIWSSVAKLHADKQRGPCGTAIPSSTSPATATGESHKQLSTGSLRKHDVFLNHRGPDVKDTFVSHLEAALRRAGHDPFLDVVSLEKGHLAFNSIDEALAGVVVHVAVFSPAYAESKYCLNELCDMLDSKKPVIPVYYNVEPENLRWTEMGPFAEAFGVAPEILLGPLTVAGGRHSRSQGLANLVTTWVLKAQVGTSTELNHSFIVKLTSVLLRLHSFRNFMEVE